MANGWRYILSDIDFDQSEERAVLDVVRSKWLSQGPKTAEFEKAFATYMGVENALSVSNCTAALHMALAVLGIKEGDEVIVPSLTFVATANAVRYTGATPVFADIQSLKHPLISPEDIQRKITPKTRAIIVMHYAGYPCDMEAIARIASDNDLFVVEDSAHAIGSRYKGRQCGTIADIGCYSFFANKNLPTGEGGMIIAKKPELYDQLRKMRSHGMTTMTWDRAKGHAFTYDVVTPGYNYRTTEISSAIGLVQLAKLDRNNRKRNDLFAVYESELSNVAGVTIPFANERGDFCRHIMPIVLDIDIERQSFMEAMKSEGIQTSIHYPYVHGFSTYSGLPSAKPGSLPLTEEYSHRTVTIPMHPLLESSDVKMISESVREIVAKLKKS